MSFRKKRGDLDLTLLVSDKEDVRADLFNFNFGKKKSRGRGANKTLPITWTPASRRSQDDKPAKRRSTSGRQTFVPKNLFTDSEDEEAPPKKSTSKVSRSKSRNKGVSKSVLTDSADEEAPPKKSKSKVSRSNSRNTGVPKSVLTDSEDEEAPPKKSKSKVSRSNSRNTGVPKSAVTDSEDEETPPKKSKSTSTVSPSKSINNGRKKSATILISDDDDTPPQKSNDKVPQMASTDEDENLVNIVVSMSPRKESSTLANFNNFLKVKRSYLAHHISYIEPSSHREDGFEEYPGVTVMDTDALDGHRIGYMKIKPHTVKPLDPTETKIIYWIFNDKITVRSCGGTVKDSKNEAYYLYGKELCRGSTLVVPAGACFTLENVTTNEVLLGYVIFGEADVVDSNSANIDEQA